MPVFSSFQHSPFHRLLYLFPVPISQGTKRKPQPEKTCPHNTGLFSDPLLSPVAAFSPKKHKGGHPFPLPKQLFFSELLLGKRQRRRLKGRMGFISPNAFLPKNAGRGPGLFSLPELAAELNAAFGGSRLTNSHNELLTSLVNTGIAGTFLYLGIQLSFMARCLKRKTEADALYPMAACVFCYLIHNLVSFSQVLNLPFLFLILGMGEGVLRSSRFSP